MRRNVGQYSAKPQVRVEQGIHNLEEVGRHGEDRFDPGQPWAIPCKDPNEALREWSESAFVLRVRAGNPIAS